MKKYFSSFFLSFAASIMSATFVQAQTAAPIQAPRNESGYIRCGQVDHDNYFRSLDPDFDKKRAEVEKVIQKGVEKIEQAKLKGDPQAFAQYTIPIVVHVVWNTAAENVTDAKVTAMIAQLNMDWSRTNTDAGNTPAAFQSLAANMEIQFCLATKDPNGNPTTGIIHKQTSTTSFANNGAVQSSASGGDDPWDQNKYLNIWTCNFSGGLLGYGFTPPISSSYGTAVEYCTVGSLTSPGCGGSFGLGRTLSHEIGHCFNLGHIWGDDGGSCSGTDGVADTPNQADATSGCYSFPHTDGCTTTSPGIMYMNYMDYSSDNCYNMFTAGQKARAHSAIASYLMSIANNAATACGPAAALDAGINSIVTPNGTTCSTTFTPVVKLQNYGATTLTSCTINYHIDANPNQTFNWTGSLATSASTNVTLPSMSTTAGTHTFTSSTSGPNAGTDGNTSNDQSSFTFSIVTSAATLPLVEGFQSTFPPSGWSLYNSNNDATWILNSTIGSNSSQSAQFDNCSQNVPNTQDQIRTTAFDFSNASSAQMTFDVGYAPYDNQYSDTLAVYYSTNCGSAWTQIYSKGGATLASVPCAMSNTVTCGTYSDGQGCFLPNVAGAWRNDVINLSAVLGQPSVMFAFENRSGYGSNLFLDNINITSVVGVHETDINRYVSISPNPSAGMIYVNINALDLGLVSVKVFDIVGKTISEKSENISSPKQIAFNLADKTNGIYFVEVIPIATGIEKRKAIKKFVLNK